MIVMLLSWSRACSQCPYCSDSTNLSFRVTCAPSLGTVYMPAPNTDGTTNNAFTYVPNADAFGSDTFVYVASDGELESNLGGA